MPQKGWVIDLGKCIGCESCVIACKSENNTVPQQSPLQFRRGFLEAAIHVSYRTVVAKHGGAYPNPTLAFVPWACNHCQQPACIAACPVNAISKRPSDGVVLIDQSKCIGCRYCIWACPFEVPVFNENTQKVEKCTFCVQRLDKGLKPACVTTCVGRAITIEEDFDFKRSGENKPTGFAEPGLTHPSTRFIPK